MAILKERGCHHFCYLLPSHRLGSDARVVDTWVGDTLAPPVELQFEWTGNAWLMKNCGAMPVTLDGMTLVRDRPYILREGMCFSWEDEASRVWEVRSVDAPQALLMTVPPSMHFIPLRDGLIVPEQPGPKWLFHRHEAHWYIHSLNDALADSQAHRPVGHAQIIKLGSRFWQAFIPPESVVSDYKHSVETLRLYLYINDDCQVERAELVIDQNRVEFRAPAEFTLLHYLAQQRDDDLRVAMPADFSGWVSVAELQEALAMSASDVVLLVYRLFGMLALELEGLADHRQVLLFKGNSVKLGPLQVI